MGERERKKERDFSLQSLTKYLAQANKQDPGKPGKLCCRPTLQLSWFQMS